jgi:hypothetical protein
MSRFLKAASEKDSRIRLLSLSQNGGISSNTNAAAGAARAAAGAVGEGREGG